MKLKPSDLPVGTRVRYETGEQGSHIAGITKDLCVHLNAKPFVTGIIYAPPPHERGDSVCFKPDGWPLPDDAWPPGFSVSSRDMEIISKDAEIELCILTDRQYRPHSKEAADLLVKKYLEDKS